MPNTLFTRDMVTHLKALGATTEFDILQSCYDNFIEWQVPEIILGDPKSISEQRRARNNFQILTQGLLHRSINLIRTIPDLLDQANVYGLALLTRGNLEGLAQLGYFCNRLTSLQDKKITFEVFYEQLANTLMSVSHPSLPQAPKPLHIMDCIRKSDQYLKRKDDNNEEVIMDSYEWLSNYCHPNFMSSSSAYTLNKEKEAIEFRHEPVLIDKDIELLGYLEMSTRLFELFYADAMELAKVLED